MATSETGGMAHDGAEEAKTCDTGADIDSLWEEMQSEDRARTSSGMSRLRPTNDDGKDRATAHVVPAGTGDMQSWLAVQQRAAEEKTKGKKKSRGGGKKKRKQSQKKDGDRQRALGAEGLGRAGAASREAAVGSSGVVAAATTATNTPFAGCDSDDEHETDAIEITDVDVSLPETAEGESGSSPRMDWRATATALQADLARLNDDSPRARRTALRSMLDTLTSLPEPMPEEFAEEQMEAMSKALFQRFGDPVEACRETVLRITTLLFERIRDFTPYLAYLFPALMRRCPNTISFDEETNLFVHNADEHEAYKRGRATDRQDRDGTAGHTIIEPSEEARLLLCKMLSTLIHRIAEVHAFSVLHPYFMDVVLFLQHQLRDPFPDLKCESAEMLAFLAQVQPYELGMKHFAIALVRASLPLLNYRHARVRLSGVEMLWRCMCVFDRAKRKGAGTEAIVDVIGFREDNVLSVSSFYKHDVQLNYMALLAQDSSAQVREKTAQMLRYWLTELPDRYDHHTRLLPYLLDCVSDDVPAVSRVALQALAECGAEYERDHSDDIIERRQYGVDGSSHCNHDKPLPAPFVERPRIGTRLYVRGNSRRFLKAILRELTNWISTTRLQSARLLRTITVFSEEQLTQDIHELAPVFVQALRVSKSDGAQQELQSTLMDIFELTGRYVAPHHFLPFFLPYVNEDPEVACPYGTDVEVRVCVLEVLGAMLDGCLPSTVVPHLQNLMTELVSDALSTSELPRLREASHRVIVSILRKLKGRGKAAVESHFLSTGRLSSMDALVASMVRRLFTDAVDGLDPGREGLEALASMLEQSNGVGGLFLRFGPQLLSDLLSEWMPDPLWSDTSGTFAQCEELLLGQFPVVHMSCNGAEAGMVTSHEHSAPALVNAVADMVVTAIDQAVLFGEDADTMQRALLATARLWSRFCQLTCDYAMQAQVQAQGAGQDTGRESTATLVAAVCNQQDEVLAAALRHPLWRDACGGRSFDETTCPVEAECAEVQQSVTPNPTGAGQSSHNPEDLYDRCGGPSRSAESTGGSGSAALAQQQHMFQSALLNMFATALGLPCEPQWRRNRSAPTTGGGSGGAGAAAATVAATADDAWVLVDADASAWSALSPVTLLSDEVLAQHLLTVGTCLDSVVSFRSGDFALHRQGLRLTATIVERCRGSTDAVKGRMRPYNWEGRKRCEGQTEDDSGSNGNRGSCNALQGIGHVIIEPIMPFLRHCLNDSCQELNLAAAELMGDMAYLLQSHHAPSFSPDPSIDSILDPDPAPFTLLALEALDRVTAASSVIPATPQAATDADNPVVERCLDVLRLLAVFDVQAVRAQVNTALASPAAASWSREARQALHDIADHCELLAQLAR